MNSTQDLQDDNDDNYVDIHQELLRVLCNCERVLPSTELSVLFHILVHVPQMVNRWNGVRNFWCFFGERYVIDIYRYLHVHKQYIFPFYLNCRCMGYFIRFIKNRDLAIENIVSTYSRSTLVTGAPSELVESTVQRLSSTTYYNPKKSLIKLAQEVHKRMCVHIVTYRYTYVHALTYVRSWTAARLQESTWSKSLPHDGIVEPSI